MAVRVMIKRWVPTEKEKDLVSLITELRSMASKQPGYISGETMRHHQQSRRVSRHQHLGFPGGLEQLDRQSAPEGAPGQDRHSSREKNDLRYLPLSRKAVFQGGAQRLPGAHALQVKEVTRIPSLHFPLRSLCPYSASAISSSGSISSYLFAANSNRSRQWDCCEREPCSRIMNDVFNSLPVKGGVSDD